jgi:acetoin utilization protein AcuC
MGEEKVHTLLSYHELFSQYDLGEGHPYRGSRFPLTYSLLKQKSILKRQDVTLIDPHPASKEDLLRAHDPDYVELILKLASRSAAYDSDTPLSPKILEAAMLMIGGEMEIGARIMEGQAERGILIGGGFHHAGKTFGGGFCFFNDIAVTIEHLRDAFRLQRALVVDFDVHAGNGTSDIYYDDPSVLLISIHQDPRTIYPGTGFIDQIGRGEGEGYNINIPLPPGTGDDTYLYALKEILIPIAREFQPQLILANGGSDAHFADRLGDLNLTVNGFFKVSKLISKASKESSRGRLMLLLCSGYNPQVLAQVWYSLICGILELDQIDVTDPYNPPQEDPTLRQRVEQTLNEIRRTFAQYWSSLR